MDLEELIKDSNKKIQSIKNIKHIERFKDETDEDYVYRLLEIKSKLNLAKSNDDANKIINLITTITTISLGFITFIMPCLNAIFTTISSRKEVDVKKFLNIFSSFEIVLNRGMNVYIVLIMILGIFIAILSISSSKINKKNKKIDYIIENINIRLEKLKK